MEITKELVEKLRYEKRFVVLECTHCHKEFVLKRWQYNQRKGKTTRGLFCSCYCATVNHNVSEEMRRKMGEKQRGVSKPQCGRKGHTVTEETKEKIRKKKLGRPAPQDHAVILRELAFRGTEKYAITKGLVPDAIYIEDGRLVALELQKCRWEAAIRRKMMAYDNRIDYDKVVLVWYNLKGERVKEWQKENNEWTLVTK